MEFEYSDKVKRLQRQLLDFMEDHVEPRMAQWRREVHAGTYPVSFMADLKALAREEGLWNLFLPDLRDDEPGTGLSNLEYAPLAEIMGRVPWASEVFNCNAPDTGNMETIARYGTDEQKERWLQPMLAGEIYSAFVMTEPEVASSDATNIACSILRDGDNYVINGRKWFATGGMRENCELFIVMGKTDPDNPDRHRQQSMILVPKDTPGITIVRSLTTFGYDEAPMGEPEIVFDDVRVPASNILLGEGRGFEIAQGRLGPGRVHHCMRLIGSAQRALELACVRADSRSTFGRKLSEHQSVREDLAKSFCDVEQARLLTLKCAAEMDRVGNKEARDLLAAIKVAVPEMACRVIDRAIQIHGAAGLTEDTFLASAFAYARQIRIADGPDQVHMMSLGRRLVRRYAG